MSDYSDESESSEYGEVYEVEKIVGERIVGYKKQYKVQWKGFPIEEATWEPLENLKNANEKLREYKSKRFQTFTTVEKPLNVQAVVGARMSENGVVYSVVGRGYDDIKEISSKRAKELYPQYVIDYYLETSSKLIQ